MACPPCCYSLPAIDDATFIRPRERTALERWTGVIVGSTGEFCVRAS
jgi:hypothetical protein